LANLGVAVAVERRRWSAQATSTVGEETGGVESGGVESGGEEISGDFEFWNESKMT
jgi:hypothetical protein